MGRRDDGERRRLAGRRREACSRWLAEGGRREAGASGPGRVRVGLVARWRSASVGWSQKGAAWRGAAGVEAAAQHWSGPAGAARPGAAVVSQDGQAGRREGGRGALGRCCWGGGDAVAIGMARPKDPALEGPGAPAGTTAARPRRPRRQRSAPARRFATPKPNPAGEIPGRPVSVRVGGLPAATGPDGRAGRISGRSAAPAGCGVPTAAEPSGRLEGGPLRGGWRRGWMRASHSHARAKYPGRRRASESSPDRFGPKAPPGRARCSDGRPSRRGSRGSAGDAAASFAAAGAELAHVPSPRIKAHVPCCARPLPAQPPPQPRAATSPPAQGSCAERLGWGRGASASPPGEPRPSRPRALAPRPGAAVLKRGPAGWSGWSVGPRRRLSRSVGWADGTHGDTPAAGAACSEAASRVTRRPVARGVACPRLGGGARRARIGHGGVCGSGLCSGAARQDPRRRGVHVHDGCLRTDWAEERRH